MNAFQAFFNRSELTRTIAYFRKEFALVGIFSAVSNLLMLAPTLYMLQVYDRVIPSGIYVRFARPALTSQRG